MEESLSSGIFKHAELKRGSTPAIMHSLFFFLIYKPVLYSDFCYKFSTSLFEVMFWSRRVETLYIIINFQVYGFERLWCRYRKALREHEINLCIFHILSLSQNNSFVTHVILTNLYKFSVIEQKLIYIYSKIGKQTCLGLINPPMKEYPEIDILKPFII